MDSATTAVPGHVAGTWTISPSYSEVRFTVRHLGVSTVHGRFNDVSGVIVTGDTAERSSVTATIAAGSVDTGVAARDEFLRSAEVLDADEHRELRFRSTAVRAGDGSLLIDGELTVRGRSAPVTFTVEVGGFTDDPVDSAAVLGLAARTTLRRSDFGFGTGLPALVVGDDVTVQLNILAIRDL